MPLAHGAETKGWDLVFLRGFTTCGMEYDVISHEDVKKLVDKAPVSNVSNNERVKRWRRNNRAAYNAYMREYMREWRKRNADKKGNRDPHPE